MFSETVSLFSNDLSRMGISSDHGYVGLSGVPGQGPYMQIALSISDGLISQARFDTYGCPVAIACGSFLTHWVQRKTVQQVRVIDSGDLERILGGLPLGKEHCAALAVSALQSALDRIESQVK